MKIKEIIKLIEEDSWFYARQAGCHRQFKHPFKKGTVTVAGKLSNDLDRRYSEKYFKTGGSDLVFTVQINH